MHREAFTQAMKTTKVPLLVLDQKWHRLFALKHKSPEIVSLEEKLKEALSQQGQANQKLKELKKLKNTLMQEIVANMEGKGKADPSVQKKMDENKRLIDDINEQIHENEDILIGLPKEMAGYNNELMMLTMEFCYQQIRDNYAEAQEISEWIKDVRIELKKKIIRKQNREINNKEIYAYMHDIFGKDIVDLFDMKSEVSEIATGEDRPTGDTSEDRVLSKGESKIVNKRK